MSAAFAVGLILGVTLGLVLWLVILPTLAARVRHDDW